MQNPSESILTGGRHLILFRIALDARKWRLQQSLVVRLLPKAALRRIGNVERMELRRIFRPIAALHDERVCLAALHVQLRYQQIVEVPGDAPRRVLGERSVAALAARRSDARRNVGDAADLPRRPGQAGGRVVDQRVQVSGAAVVALRLWNCVSIV